MFAVVQDKDAAIILEKLVAEGFRATRLATTGGFLSEGNTTLFLGVDDDKVDRVSQVISRFGKSRSKMVTPMTPLGAPLEPYLAYPVEVVVGGATIFTLPVEAFYQF